MLAEFSGFCEAKHFPKENEERDAVIAKQHSPKGKRSAAIPASPYYFFALQKNSFECLDKIECLEYYRRWFDIRDGDIFKTIIFPGEK